MIEVEVPIEVDITYTNGRWNAKRAQKKLVKHFVIGFYRRAIANVPPLAEIVVLENDLPDTIHEVVRKHIKAGAMLYAEQKILPSSLKVSYPIIEFNPAVDKAKNDVHVNHVKNMWRDLKRNIKREHISVSREHLQGYCALVTFHINNAHLNPFEKFELMIKNCASTPHKNYKELTKKNKIDINRAVPSISK